MFNAFSNDYRIVSFIIHKEKCWAQQASKPKIRPHHVYHCQTEKWIKDEEVMDSEKYFNDIPSIAKTTPNENQPKEFFYNVPAFS